MPTTITQKKQQALKTLAAFFEEIKLNHISRDKPVSFPDSIARNLPNNLSAILAEEFFANTIYEIPATLATRSLAPNRSIGQGFLPAISESVTIGIAEISV